MKTVTLTEAEATKLKKLLKHRIQRNREIIQNIRRGIPFVEPDTREQIEKDCVPHRNNIKLYTGILEKL